jgi:hypothetical protein
MRSLLAGAFVLAVFTTSAVADQLNPQPLPPIEAGSATHGTTNNTGGNPNKVKTKKAAPTKPAPPKQ